MILAIKMVASKFLSLAKTFSLNIEPVFEHPNTIYNLIIQRSNNNPELVDPLSDLPFF